MRNTRGITLAVVLVACGGKKDTPRGISNLKVAVTASESPGDKASDVHLDLTWNYRPTEKQPTTGGVEDRVYDPLVRAACQVGAIRYVDADESDSVGPSSGTEYDADPFLDNDLPGKPSSCDLQFFERLDRNAAPQRILHVCWADGKQTPGPCPPNAVEGPGTSGYSVLSFDIKVVPHQDLSAEHLVLAYTVQSHQKPNLKTLVRVAIDCPGDHDDEEEHPEGGALDAGEAFAAANNHLGAEVPAPDAACTVTFSSVDRQSRNKSVIQEYCYVNRAVKPGACPAAPPPVPAP
jgi:hypothetical protein